MNLFVADPHWGWWIILYFFLGGIAAGAYFTATLIDLKGNPEDRDLARVGYWVAFPLVALCGLFLIVDLEQPLRFWHMLLKSEAGSPIFKYWSPMSVGSWALLIFGLCSFLSFLGSLWPSGRLARVFRFSGFALGLEFVGCVVGFFIAAYTGALLTATSQPIWSDSPWIASLFLASAASTGIAVIIIVARLYHIGSDVSLHRLEHADLWALVLELVVFAIFLGSLDERLWALWSTAHGKVLILGTLVLGVLVPLLLHLRLGIERLGSALAASAFALLGGFLLRYGMVTSAPELLSRGPAAPAHFFSPEEGRLPGRSLGADPVNRPNPSDPADIRPRSKAFNTP